MGTKTTVVIFNEDTNKHEPMVKGDVISEEVLPPPRKAWLGNLSFAVVHIASGTDMDAAPDLEVGSTYLVHKYDETDDFSNVGHGADESLPFVATGTTPTKWKRSTVYKVVEELTLTEHYNTIGFTVTASLRSTSWGVAAILTTSVPYWQEPLAVYDTSKLQALSATQGSANSTNTKLLLELL